MTGRVLRSVALPDDEFAEGLALVGRPDHPAHLEERAVDRTWDADTFEPEGTSAYEGEGWGLCFDGQAPGHERRQRRADLPRCGHVRATRRRRVSSTTSQGLRLNELECVDGEVWANVWIRPTASSASTPDRAVLTGRLDLAALRALGGPEAEGWDVLNGIAYDAAADTYLVTGKLWSELFEIRLVAPEVPADPPRPGLPTPDDGRLDPRGRPCYPAKGTRGRPGHLHSRPEEAACQRLSGMLRLAEMLPGRRDEEVAQVRAAELAARDVRDRQRDDGIERAVGQVAMHAIARPGGHPDGTLAVHGEAVRTPAALADGHELATRR